MKRYLLHLTQAHALAPFAREGSELLSAIRFQPESYDPAARSLARGFLEATDGEILLRAPIQYRPLNASGEPLARATRKRPAAVLYPARLFKRVLGILKPYKEAWKTNDKPATLTATKQRVTMTPATNWERHEISAETHHGNRTWPDSDGLLDAALAAPVAAAFTVSVPLLKRLCDYAARAGVPHHRVIHFALRRHAVAHTPLDQLTFSVPTISGNATGILMLIETENNPALKTNGGDA